MKRLFLSLLFPLATFGQNWSGVIDPARAIDWSTAGMALPDANWTQCGSTIAAYSGTAATINTQISGCAANTYVLLGAGTFTLSTGIDFGHHNNVVVRGSAANSTFLVFTGAGAGGYNSIIAMEGSVSANGFEQNVCDWTAGYSKGTTVITLANCGSTTPAVGNISNLHVGSVLILDQVDEAADTGQIWNCGTQNACSGTIQGGESRTNGPSVGGITLRSQQQGVVVTAINGLNITISPGLYMPNWRTGQAPQAWYATTTATQEGLENLSYDNCGSGETSSSCGTPSGSGQSVMLSNCNKCWVSGVRGLWANRSHVRFLLTTHNALKDSYFYQNISHATVSYGAEMMGAWDGIIENNIFQQDTDSEPSCSGACEGNVIAYNFDINNVYGTNGWMQAGNYQHAAGDAFNLWEGNIGPGYHADQVHGTHAFETVFRNYLIGNNQSLCNGVACNAQTVPIVFDSGSRYMNAIGNVLGKAGYHTFYKCNATSASSCNVGNHPGGTGKDTMIYSFGYTGNGGQQNTSITGYCGQPGCSTHGTFDPQVSTYAMLWGNWDVVNNAVQWTSAEVPSGISPYSNAVPATHVLAPSFYLNATAHLNCGTGIRFWNVNGTCPQFPPIGPDVSNGNINSVGGFANQIPAQLCYANVMGGPADGTGAVLTFNASSCYANDPVISSSSNFFGIDQTQGTGGTHNASPTITFTVGRLWDSACVWPLINTSSGTEVWTNCDTLVTYYQGAGATVSFTMGRTPSWAITGGVGSCTGSYATNGCAQPPSDIDTTDTILKTFVTDLVNHFNSTFPGMHFYIECVNEADLAGEWTGTMAELVTYCTDLKTTAQAIDPTVVILGPAASTFNQFGVHLYPTYLATTGAPASFDVINIHPYFFCGGSTPCTNPEIAIAAFGQLSTLMASNGISSKPIAMSETDWGKGVANTMSDDLKVAWMGRFYAYAWNAGVSFVWWYAWDASTSNLALAFGTLCTGTPTCTPIPAATAFNSQQSWYIGSGHVVNGCNQNADGLGTWVCPLTLSGGASAEIVFNSTGPQTISSSGFNKQNNLDGTSSLIVGGTVTANLKPIMLSNVSVTGSPGVASPVIISMRSQ